jgi:hypothetical protein
MITSALSFWILGDTFNLEQMIGGSLVMFGLYFTLQVKGKQNSGVVIAESNSGSGGRHSHTEEDEYEVVGQVDV